MHPYEKAKRDRAHALNAEINEIRDLAVREGRDLTDDELTKIRSKADEYNTLAEEITEMTEHEARVRSVNELAAKVLGGGAGGHDDPRRPYSLLPKPEEIEQLRSAARDGIGASVWHTRILDAAEPAQHDRSVVTLNHVGGSVVPVNGNLPEPRRLVTVVGLEPIQSDSSGGSGPLFGATSAEDSPGTAEESTKPEQDQISELAIPIVPLARWTDITSMARLSQVGFIEQLASWHAQGVAKDEDKLIIDALEAAAGEPIGTGNGAADVRTAVAIVADAVAAAADVIIVNPNDYAAVSTFSPTSGLDVETMAAAIGPARFYPSSGVAEGTVLVAALRAGGRFLVASPPRTADFTNLKTNVTTVLLEEHVGFGVRVAGSVVAIDLTVSPE